ncbi:hypothetical protein [Nocardia bovistercoris]|uniref:Uncharacterized protein n=1 Tax=Nocardia bovistercoris TaxID=2785916 RepID=A0A931IH34_9NOCA|nr:hypothetical protein [Nocardia bovistercoris]MBH0780463.1 hypothetical protein [Nocardia bovistercoris]
MAVRSAFADDNDVVTGDLTRRGVEAWRFRIRPRAVVVAPSATDAVVRLGGWVFDKSIGGWEVMTAIPGGGGHRALEILGARIVDLEEWLSPPKRWASLEMLAVASELYAADERIREIVRQRLVLGTKPNLVWGGPPATELHDVATATRHRISVAGRAFKRTALGALEQDTAPQSDTELFWTTHGGPSAFRTDAV